MQEFTNPQPPTPKHDLTERELEVLRLIAQGKSNKDISEDLVLSEKTVKTHVSNILQKLHLSDRTQAAVYALAPENSRLSKSRLRARTAFRCRRATTRGNI